jgi:hypothetical protein
MPIIQFGDLVFIEHVALLDILFVDQPQAERLPGPEWRRAMLEVIVSGSF